MTVFVQVYIQKYSSATSRKICVLVRGKFVDTVRNMREGGADMYLGPEPRSERTQKFRHPPGGANQPSLHQSYRPIIISKLGQD